MVERLLGVRLANDSDYGSPVTSARVASFSTLQKSGLEQQTTRSAATACELRRPPRACHRGRRFRAGGRFGAGARAP